MNKHIRLRVILLIALLALGLTVCARDTSSRAGGAAPPASSGDDAGPVLGTLEVEGFELGFRPATLQVDKPGRYTVTFTNAGHTDHDWVAGETRLLARPGETVSGTVVVPAGGLEFVCSFPGHAPAGMRGSIAVAGSADVADEHEQRTRPD